MKKQGSKLSRVAKGLMVAGAFAFASTLGGVGLTAAKAPEAEAVCWATHYVWGYRIIWGAKMWGWWPVGNGCAPVYR